MTYIYALFIFQRTPKVDPFEKLLLPHLLIYLRHQFRFSVQILKSSKCIHSLRVCAKGYERCMCLWPQRAYCAH